MATIQDYLDQVQAMLVSVQADGDAEVQKIADLNVQLTTAQNQKAIDDEVVSALEDLVAKLQSFLPPVVPPTVVEPVPTAVPVDASTAYVQGGTQDDLPVRMVV